MKWKDVPMPPRIAALPRDKRGFPVPWISDWETETEVVDERGMAWHIEQGHPEWGDYVEYCTHEDGVGEPNLGALCAPRQLHGMLNRLCDVCGVKVGKTAFFMGAKDLHTQGYRELPLHLECALYAGQVCPGLVTKARGEIWVSVTEDYTCNMVRKYENGDREFVGMHDPTWRLLDAMGVRSVMIGVTAVPVQGPKTRHLTLDEFLNEHGLKHPYRQEITA